MSPRSRFVRLWWCALLLIGCAKGHYVELYKTSSKAPSYTADSIQNLEHLGATLVDQGVNFGVYSEHATKVQLFLFDDPESDRPTKQFDLTRFGDVWNIHVQGVGVGQHYGFVAWGPNWPYEKSWLPGKIDGFKADVDADGNRFDPNKLLIDPYARAFHREHDWSKGSVASGPKRTEVTYAASSKAVVVQSHYAWSDSETAWREARKDPNFVGHKWQDLIVYEVHPKGFTKSPASGVQHPGTFLGVGEMAGYLKDLGVNAVELLPVMEKPLDGGYWGYQTIGFFSPELDYCWDKRPGFCIDEFKTMVDQLHQAGIELILDVVYNHTGEGGLWRNKIEIDASPDPSLDAQLVNFDPKEIAGIYSFRGLDNSAYYALGPDDLGLYWNNTGVGDETRCNHRPMRRLIMDSLHYWASEFHVDGFRFDLAPILGEKDLDYNNWDDPKNTVLQEIIDDQQLLEFNTRIIAEPWSAGGYYGPRIGAFPASTKAPGVGWGEWNGRFRDWWRAFVNYDDWKLNSQEGGGDGGFLMTGSYDWYHPSGRRPYHSVNFVTVHDGFTMYDLFSYDQKQNRCGPLNPICCQQVTSPFCDLDSGESNNRSRNWGQDQEDFKRQLMRNLFVAMMISHGTPMLYGGDEWLRTQLGNNNAYSTAADNEWNWFDWGVWQAKPERQRMHDFVRQVVSLRKSHAYAFEPADYGQGAPFAWKSAQNTDQVNWGGKNVMLHYYDKTRGPELAILINMETGPVDFTLPTGRTWRRLVDTQQYFDTDAYFTSADFTGTTPVVRSYNATIDAPTPVPGSSYTVPTRTIVVLEAAP